MSQTVRVRYSAGGWLGLVRGRCLVALPADASEETAAVSWDLLAGTPGVEQLLATVLSGRLDLTGLPSFAIVSFREGTSVHAILRGDVSLRMTTIAGAEAELHGTGVATWNERVFREIGSFELLVDDAVTDAEDLPLESGAVRLGSLHADLGTTSPDHGEIEEPSAASVPEPGPEPDAEPEQEQEQEQEPALGTEPVTDEQADEDERGAEPEDHEPSGEDITDQDATIAPESRTEPAAPAASADPADKVPEEAEDHTIAGPGGGASASGGTDAPAGSDTPAEESPRPGGSVPGPQELIDSVPWLAAARKAVPPQSPGTQTGTDAAEEQSVEVPADLNMTVAPGPSYGEEDHAEETSDAAGTEVTGAEDADDADTVLSPSAPGAAPVPAPPAPPAAPPSGPSVSGSPALAAEDHDGETVMKSDLDPADLPAGAPAPAPVPPPTTGPVVLARTCSDGHANPPTSATCGICGQSLSGEAQQVRRPSLGRIRMSTGEVVELDRPAVVGRQPQAHRVGSGTMPRMVQVRSPNGDISRSHCEVVLEGWHVQLRDLKATNGTVLIREGQPPRRLGQGESLMVLDGDIADLGDGVSLRFEGLL